MSFSWKPYWLAAGWLLAAGIGSALALQTPSQPTGKGWKEVKDAIAQGLPKTAIEQLDTIYKTAIEGQKYPEAIRALATQQNLKAQIDGSGPVSFIHRFAENLESVPEQMRPVLHVLQGHAYWSYFQENRYRFAQRTTGGSTTSNDITTWDLKRIFGEIAKHYSAALAAEDTLKAIPIADYDDLLNKGTLPDTYRPTLFDFLAFEALNFYSAGEQAGARPQDAFEFEANSPALGTTEEFLAWKPESSDSEAIKLKAIALFQRLLTIHAKDEDRSAFLDADLARLQFGYANSVGDSRKERYLAALKRFANENGTHELSSTARFRWASLLVEDDNRVEGRKVAQEGQAAFPESMGGKACQNLINEIESRALQLQTERVWSNPASKFRASYKNLKELHFRVYKIDWLDYVRNKKQIPYGSSQEELQQVAKMTPARQWKVEIPATPDYNLNTYDFDAPTDLEPGFYYLHASSNSSFTEQNNVVAGTGVWVSKLALVLNQSWNQGKVEGFVLDNESGEPIADAKVTAIVHGNRRDVPTTEKIVSTDRNGRFSIQETERQVLIHASYGNDSLAVRDGLYLGRSYPTPQVNVQCVLFTDRSLYRPGQQIQFKGICLRADSNANRYEVVAGHGVNVAFHDNNGNVVEMKNIRSNDFGSFSGTFNIPRDRGTGSMSIQVAGLAGAHFQVEEYKRPKFKVELNTPEASPKLQDEVAVGGVANSYTGMPIQNAQVTYRVQRVVRWPIWFRSYAPWRLPPDAGASQEIANGTTTTDSEGKFQVKFTAVPDRSIDPETHPIFTYSVVADVTDSTGETRSDEFTTSVGYVALEASISANDWQTTDKPVQFNLTTNSLDGKPLPADGKVKVYRLVEPQSVIRAGNLSQIHYPVPRRRGGSPPPRIGAGPANTDAPDPSSLTNWEQGELVGEQTFSFKEDSKREVSLALAKGVFRAIVDTKDRFGKPVQAITHVIVVDPKASSLGIKVPDYFQAEKWQLEPGETFVGLWGTGYDKGRAFVEVLSNGKTLQQFWTDAQSTQTRIEQPITEEMRGGVTIRVLYVRENRSYIASRHIDVPWTNKDLKLSWQRMVSKLEPGKKEKFKLTVQGPKASNAVAELVAGMYDASLDAYHPHQWTQKLNYFRSNNDWSNWLFQNNPEYLINRGNFTHEYVASAGSYRSFPSEILYQSSYHLYVRPLSARGRSMDFAAPAAPMAMAKGMAMAEAAPEMASLSSADMVTQDAAAPAGSNGVGNSAGEGGSAANVNLDSVSPRKNLQETAFFFPHVTKSADGTYELEFVVPEALTSWKVMAFAHDRELRSGYLQAEVVTNKDLMVEPNPPRFLREGDEIEFSVKVSNTSDKEASGKVALKLSSALTDKSVDVDFNNQNVEQQFNLGGNESKSFFWKIKVPDGAYPVIYRAIGGTGTVSDGEEGMLPVLSNRILVTESLPLPIRGKTTKEFEFKSLLESAKSDTLKSQSLTVQMVSQPAWYAVLSLPYLMEYPYDCSEQVFNRFYANRLGQHIANSDPKIRRIFDVWKQIQPDALKSPLEKNQDIKSILIEETPWLRDAQQESEARRNVGILFDDARLNSESQRALALLAQMQNENGTWPWFAGGPDNEYLTLYIATGFGRLKNLGVQVDSSIALRAFQRLDNWMRENHEKILKSTKTPDENHLSHVASLYLYGRTFFLDELPIAEENQSAFKYWQSQAAKHWLKQPRQTQAQIALALHRLSDKETPKAILKSILEFSSTSEEMGMFWADRPATWWWYDSPIETQAVLIEAFDEVASDKATVEECKVWLLKQKQTQNWKTTKATADAVYALLLRGSNSLASDELVAVEIGGEVIKPQNVEAGTGFYEERFLRTEVKPEFGKIKVTKIDDGVSWGSVHWQYLEDINKVKSYDGTPLKLEKKLFKKINTKEGQKLVELDGSLQVGDELVTRIVLRTDRDMEYVHLKDQRGSGTEPVNVLSGYRFQDGLGYYESTRDTASHFFIDYLRQGTYVFEYSVRIQHAGNYPSGMASIECMYAPEFNSHSESIMIQALPQGQKPSN